jgi:hypothetical protein
MSTLYTLINGTSVNKEKLQNIAINNYLKSKYQDVGSLITLMVNIYNVR